MTIPTLGNFEFDHQYIRMVHNIITCGNKDSNRTGTNSVSRFGNVLALDLSDGQLPIITTKKVFFKTLIHELVWFIWGYTDIAYLKANHISIWDSWVIKSTARYDENNKLVGGSIGNAAYGALWRKWEDTRIVPTNDLDVYIQRGYTFVTHLSHTSEPQCVVTRTIDQLQNALDLLRTNPDSRRIIVSAWNPGRLEDAALPPCHCFYQFYTRKRTAFEINQYRTPEWDENEYGIDEQLEDCAKRGIPTRALSCLLYMRSNDMPVGNPFNITQYAALTHLMAKMSGMVPDKFIWVGGNTHVYEDQIDVFFKEQKSRQPMECTPVLIVSPKIGLDTQLNDVKAEHFTLKDYMSHPRINYPVAV